MVQFSMKVVVRKICTCVDRSKMRERERERERERQGGMTESLTVLPLCTDRCVILLS